MTDEPKWKEDVDAIRAVLMADWDPIGCGVPDDEYDSYIPEIYRMLQREVDASKLVVWRTVTQVAAGAATLGCGVQRFQR